MKTIKPRPICVKDTWSDKFDGGWVYAEIHKGDNGLCVQVDYQGDMETKDVWLNAKDAGRLGKRLLEYAKYLRGKNGCT
jgi:hypothetical protein